MSDGYNSPLRVEVIDGDLRISIGIQRLDGNEDHPSLPALKVFDWHAWAIDVKNAMERQREDGSSMLNDMIDHAIHNAIASGAMGLASDSPTCTGTCALCDKEFVPLRWVNCCKLCMACAAVSDNRRTGR